MDDQIFKNLPQIHEIFVEIRELFCLFCFTMFITFIFKHKIRARSVQPFIENKQTDRQKPRQAKYIY